ncbi:unnamed protein product [Rotaria sordida]|uniref:Uncharacterized protein n=1 Tax=Rotaria sordida TaxID=392033 RepID=A0A814HV08_9BILA|nr:unnamed protein product [Rotaria sordida]CAF3780351.1 unnamed protein product [Rotaria sordida]
MSKKEKKSRQLMHNSETTVLAQEIDTKIKSTASALTTSSSIIKGVCDDNLFNGTCENMNCDQLHLTEPIQLTDGHFHDRLLKENWSYAIEPLKNIEQFIGITNVHKSSMWNNTLSIVPESLKSKAIGECGLDLLNNEQLSLQTEIFISQIKLANEFHLPLIIHCRQLDQQLFDILKKFSIDSSMNESENNENQQRFVFETDSPYLKSSSLLINTEDNCPILGTLTVSAYVTKNILKNDQWTNNLLKIDCCQIKKKKDN